jgi:uncharacterized protein DUF4154
VNRPAPHRDVAHPRSKLLWGKTLRAVAALMCLALATLVTTLSHADSRVPLSLQVLLLSHLGSYDRNFKARAGSVANVLVVSRKGNSDSAFEQASLAKALADLRDIGGVPVHVAEAEFTDAESLARRCRTERISVVYLTVGLEDDAQHIAAAFVNGNILTVGTSARHAENGTVVGFALEEARPRLVINLAQARTQKVDFRAEVLRLARLIGPKTPDAN